jgi:hypothetical protein
MTVLDRLLGTWDLTMHHADLAEPVTGRHHYERVLDGAWVQLGWTYDHPDFPDATVLLSEDRYHYFDVRGEQRTFELDATGDAWTLVRVAEDFSQRSTSRFEGDDRVETVGERSYDGGATWEPDYTLTLRRVVARSGG